MYAAREIENDLFPQCSGIEGASKARCGHPLMRSRLAPFQFYTRCFIPVSQLTVKWMPSECFCRTVSATSFFRPPPYSYSATAVFIELYHSAYREYIVGRGQGHFDTRHLSTAFIFCVWQKQARQGGCLDESNGPGEAAVLVKNDSTSPPVDTGDNVPCAPARPPAIEAVSKLGRTRQRPSEFRSPAPASPLRSSKSIGGLGLGLGKDQGVESAFNCQEGPEAYPKSGKGKKGGQKR